MRWLACLVMLAACRIPDDHFIGLTDDAGDGDATSMDAPPATTLSKSWIVDQTGKLYYVRKASDGALTLTTAVTTITSPQSAVVNKQGTHLFVANVTAAAGSGITDYVINPDGSLTSPAFRPTTVGGVECTVKNVTVHPNGNYLAVGCSSARIAIVSINANGAITPTSNVTLTTVGTTPENLVFTPNGTCLFAVDRTAGNLTVHRLGFDPTSGVAAFIATVASSSNRGIAVHPNGQNLYVAGTSSVQMFRIMSGCALTMEDSEPITATAAGNTSIVVAPDGHRVFVSAAGTYTFDLSVDGMMNAVSATPSLSSVDIQASIMDATLPNIIYMTTRTNGVFPATIAPSGGLTAGPSAVVPNGSNCLGFAMAP